MTMTKVDYEVIANLIVIAKEHNSEATKGLDELTMMLTGAFQVNNPRFSTYLFLKAAEHYAASEYVGR